MLLVRHLVVIAASLVILPGVWAHPTPDVETESADVERIDQLEALLARQQERLEALQQQAGAMQSDDADRAQLMRAQIRDVLSEEEFRSELMPSTLQAGYDKGFFIRSHDDKFSMKLQWHLQARYTYYGTRSENHYLLPGERRSDRSGFDFARARFRIFGHAYSKDLSYFISLTAAENSAYDARLMYAFADYRFADEFHIMVGRMRLASTRAQMRTITTYQFTELPFTDAVFGAGVGTGVRFWGCLFDYHLHWFLDITNSWNGANNRVITPDPAELDGSPGVIFRMLWHALAEDPMNDFTYEADFGYHEMPVLDLGFHYGFNNDDGDLGTSRVIYHLQDRVYREGAFGLVNTNGMHIHQFGAEAAFKWRGFSATTEFHVRMLDIKDAASPPYTPYFLLTGDGSTTAYYGGYLQLGYLLPIPGWENKFEVVARLEGLGGVSPGNEGTWIYTGGFNYYIDKQLKLQTDVSKITEVPISSSTYSLANVNDDALIWRVQLVFAF